MRISISQYTFILRDLYQEGDVLTLAEAQALNRLRGENIRNNVKKWVEELVLDKLVPGTSQHLSQDDLASLQLRVSEYDEKYQFPLQVIKREPRGVIELEALKLARALVEMEGRRLGEHLGQAELDERIDRKIGDPGVQTEARRRVAAAQDVARAELEKLL